MSPGVKGPSYVGWNFSRFFPEPWTVEESMLYIFVDSRTFRTHRALVNADSM